jgi:hypothetical protein
VRCSRARSLKFYGQGAPGAGPVCATAHFFCMIRTRGALASARAAPAPRVRVAFQLLILDRKPRRSARRGFLICKARWQSGHAAACKAVYAGSIPTLASNPLIPRGSHEHEEPAQIKQLVSPFLWLGRADVSLKRARG